MICGDKLSYNKSNLERHFVKKHAPIGEQQYIGTSVPSEKISHWANVCFSRHEIAPPCRQQPVKRFKRRKGYASLRYDIKFGMFQVR